MKAIAYLRVSTAQQAEDGVSLEAQRAKVVAYASLYDLELVDVVSEVGSAKTLNRPGLQRCISMLGSEVQALLVVKLDRLTRSVRDLGELLENVFHTHSLMAVQEQIDTRTAAGRMMLNILASVSQWEREVIGERTQAALAHKKSLGERVGQVPYGYQLADDGIHLTEEPREQRAIELIRALRQDGLSLRRIAEELSKAGHKSRGKTGAWHPNTIKRILEAA